MPARSSGLLGGSLDKWKREHLPLGKENCRGHDSRGSDERCTTEETMATIESLAKQAGKHKQTQFECKAVVPKDHRIRLSRQPDGIASFSQEEVQHETRELRHQNFLGCRSRSGRGQGCQANEEK